MANFVVNLFDHIEMLLMSRHVSLKDKMMYQYLPVYALKTLMRIDSVTHCDGQFINWMLPECPVDLMMDIGEVKKIVRAEVKTALELRVFGQHNLLYGIEPDYLD